MADQSGPARRPVTRRRAGRDRADVLEAAGRVIAHRGAEATRFVDVSEASGVPVSSLQYYFGSREDMLVAAFRHASAVETDRLREALGLIDRPWERLVRIADAALGGFSGDPERPDERGRLWVESWRFALRDPELRTDVLEDYASWRELIASAVAAGVAAGDFTADLDPPTVAVQVLALLDGMGVPVELADPAVTADRARTLALAAVGALVGTAPA
jgi:AcrR family transcriptional regulator